MKNYLTKNQLEDFKRDGFLVVRGMYSPHEIADLSRWIDALVHRSPEKGKQMVYFEDSLLDKGQRIVSRIEKFAEYHPEMGQLILAEKMMAPVREILGGDAVLFKEKINFKLPGGGGFAPHQDIQPGWDDYAPYFISVLVTVDPSTVENGCLELSAGHHKRGWIGERMRPLEGKELEGIEFIHYPMEPGDVAFFDCFAPHQSKPNLTKTQRRNLYLTYNRKSDGDWREKYYADKRKSFPPDYEREAGKEYVFKV